MLQRVDEAWTVCIDTDSVDVITPVIADVRRAVDGDVAEPSFDPDPDLVDRLEGNKRERDREIADRLAGLVDEYRAGQVPDSDEDSVG